MKANLNYFIKIAELFLFSLFRYFCVENMRNLARHYDLCRSAVIFYYLRSMHSKLFCNFLLITPLKNEETIIKFKLFAKNCTKATNTLETMYILLLFHHTPYPSRFYLIFPLLSAQYNTNLLHENRTNNNRAAKNARASNL